MNNDWGVGVVQHRARRGRSQRAGHTQRDAVGTVPRPRHGAHAPLQVNTQSCV